MPGSAIPQCFLSVTILRWSSNFREDSIRELKLEFLLWSNLTPLPVKEGPGDKAGRECPEGHQAHQRLFLPAAQPHLVRHLDLGARYDTHVIAKQQASCNIEFEIACAVFGIIVEASYFE